MTIQHERQCQGKTDMIDEPPRAAPARMSHVVTSAAIFFHRFFMRRAMRPIGHRDAHGAQPTFVPQVRTLRLGQATCSCFLLGD